MAISLQGRTRRKAAVTEEALLQKLRTQLQGLPPDKLEPQLMPPFKVAPNCRDYAPTVHFQPGFNRSLLKQVMPTATVAKGTPMLSALAMCALEAVQESES